MGTETEKTHAHGGVDGDADKDSDVSRRHFLTAATALTAGVGVVAAAIPFVKSFNPSARAQALGAPVEVDVSKLEAGTMLRVVWRGKVVYVVHRSKDMLSRIDAMLDRLRDPDSLESIQPPYAMNKYRSIKPELLVILGVCTHLGCAPLDRFDVDGAELGPDWEGGFFCPCHGSKFDLSGRVLVGVPAPTNLTVPPHSYINDNSILVGDDSGSS